MSFDLHKSEARYKRKKEELTKISDSHTREILQKYVEFHEKKIARNQTEYSSALRSLEIAQKLCNWHDFFSEKPYSVEAVKEWWKNNLERTSNRSQTKISIGTLQKFQGQASKFLKFLEFVETGEDIVFFNTKKLPPAKAGRYFIVEIPKKRKEIPRLDLDKFSKLLNQLVKSPIYYEKIAGTILISAYDLGCRFGELASLQNKSFGFSDEHLLVTLEDSKTITRTIVPILSKKYLINWQKSSPTKDDPDGYFFSGRNGGMLSYDKVSLALRKVSKEVGFSFPKGKLWHYLRHEFASRAHNMPENLIRYYLGWDADGIRGTYSHYNWKDCLPHLYKMNEGHPLLDKPLSILDEQFENQFEKQLERMIDEKVVAYLKDKTH